MKRKTEMFKKIKLKVCRFIIGADRKNDIDALAISVLGGSYIDSTSKDES